MIVLLCTRLALRTDRDKTERVTYLVAISLLYVENMSSVLAPVSHWVASEKGRWEMAFGLKRRQNGEGPPDRWGGERKCDGANREQNASIIFD